MPRPKGSATLWRESAMENWNKKTTYFIPAPFMLDMEVIVDSERVKNRSLKFKYKQHVRNNVTQSVWIDLADQDGNTWSFKPEAVKPKPEKPRKYTKRG